MKFIFYIYLLVIVSDLAFSQSILYNDPNKDQIPYELIKNFQYKVQPSSVITIDNYDNFNLGVDFAEGHIVVNPQNPTQFFNAWNINVTHYTLNGHDWYTQTPNFGNVMRGDPVAAYDSLGNLYYQNMYGNTIIGALVLKSTNNGISWSPPPAVVSVSGNDKNWIAADQTKGPFANYVYATMTRSGGGSFFRSTDFGTTFQQTAILTPHSLPGMMVAVGPNVLNGQDIPGGCVYVVTNSGTSYASVFTFFVSTDGGLTFTTKSSQSFANYVGTYVGGRNSVENMRTRPYPYITADNSYGPYRGRLYLVYASNNPAGDGNKPDIFCRYSTDQGATWSQPVIVNDDPNSHLNHQWHPAIWCDKNTGRLYIQWMDTRDTPTSDSCHIYATYSDNGGVSFVQNQRITNKKFKINCTTCGGGGTPLYLGDYNGITSNGVTSMLVWADFRNNNFASFAAYFPDFAMAINPSFVELSNLNDSSFITVSIPGVKLYDKSVKFSASISNPPENGIISFNFLEKDSITSFPDSIKLRIKTSGFVTPGTYNCTITGTGPNGTPVHKRSLTINIIANQQCSNILVKEGWNIVSVPRLASNMTPNSIFPNRTSNIYGYNGLYFNVDTLKSGQGYFVKFANNESIPICGYSFSANSISLNQGWNLIGPFDTKIPVNSIITNPANILESPFYSYLNGYLISDTLTPGTGYWVKSSQNGQITFSQNLQKINNNILQTKEDWIKITIKDSKNYISNLFLSNGIEPNNKFVLPPAPPFEIMDVRFSDGSILQNLLTNDLIFQINNASYPIKIQVEGANLIIADNINQQIFNKLIQSGEEITIDNHQLNSFKISNVSPEYSLKLNQNYPNPFNPTTNITFQIKAESEVKLTIYDILGNKIKVLVDERLKAGLHSIIFDGSNLSSGIYFYELKVNLNSEIKKMQLIK